MNGFEEMAVRFPEPFRLLWRESVGSTNDELRILAEQGMAEGLVLVAEEQVSGRGRRGAEWFSRRGESLAFSVLLRPSEERAMWSRLSLVAGLAVAEVLEGYVPMVEIKWPNDVMIAGRKVAGILVEARRDFVILGIGINVNTGIFPAGLEATSLMLESGCEVKREEVLCGVIERLAVRLREIGGGFEDLVGKVNERCFLRGKRVTMISAGGVREGVMAGVGKGGEMMLELDGGVEMVVQADEVRISDFLTR